VFWSFSSLPLTLNLTVQSGLHTELCEIDQKLQAIVAGRKRHVLQSIQEETATNIYLPSPLQSLVGPDGASGVTIGPSNSLRPSKNTVWISGEFFGVQRARDMLLQLSLNKACCSQDFYLKSLT